MLKLVLLVGAFVAFAAFVVLAYRCRWQWTGLPAAPAASPGAEERPAKTLWDWLQLLGIPVALAALAFLLSEAQSSRDQRREDQRASQQRTSAADADRENTLRTYLAQMSDLMLDRRLLRSKPGADLRNVARTATLTAVRRLDGPRRGLVVQFLAEARLLRRDQHEGATVRIASADLEHADLRAADLTGADLTGANLGKADLGGADLRRADLTAANFRRANLGGADLRAANLGGADFGGAYLRAADLTAAAFKETNLSGADLSVADLRRADLRAANLMGANLKQAKLRGARGVAMTGARGKRASEP